MAASAKPKVNSRSCLRNDDENQQEKLAECSHRTPGFGFDFWLPESTLTSTSLQVDTLVATMTPSQRTPHLPEDESIQSIGETI
jgi:hypothetical protein